ncbi:MAG TPA: TIGR04552 family protein [Myxococcota bacterium]|nr:TIGR04552 family protein [Myxococcota bacterium]
MPLSRNGTNCFSLGSIDLADLEAVRLILGGGSVVDWHKLSIEGRDEVDRFLLVNGFDVADPADEKRLRQLLKVAVVYLESNFNHHFPECLKVPGSIQDLLLVASGSSEYQKLACVILKVMHVVNHVEAQQLRFRLPVSEDQLFQIAVGRVNQTVAAMKAAGAPIVRYAANRKARDSLITKLLSKKTTFAAQVYDRLRFRVITNKSEDIVPVLSYMKDHLFPYNYVVPDQSRNQIVSTLDLLEAIPGMRDRDPGLVNRFYYEDAEESDNEVNTFSGATFRMINFVVELPIKVREMIPKDDPVVAELGSLVYIQVEFQMFDEETFRMNEVGDNNHERYKDRQNWEVIRRLVHGNRYGMADDSGWEGKTRW